MRGSPAGRAPLGSDDETDDLVEIALVEGRLTTLSSHRPRAMLDLVDGCNDLGLRPFLVCLGGVPAELERQLHDRGARLVTAPRRGLVSAWAAIAGAVALRAASRLLGRCRARAVSADLQHAAGACLEVAALRVSRDAAPLAVPVLLTARHAMHQVVGALGGSHLRILHELVGREGRLARALGRRFLDRGRGRVVAVCTNPSTRADFVAAFPWLNAEEQTFATYRPEDRLSEEERVAGRPGSSEDDGVLTACLVGGWWWWKDIDTVAEGLATCETDVRLHVVGEPLDDEVLARLRDNSRVELLLARAPTDDDTLRSIYADSDFSIVSRRAGISKESGLVVDALKLGVHLVLSTGDQRLAGVLGDPPWLTWFEAGSGAALRQAIERLATVRRPLPRPPREAPALVGCLTPSQAVSGYRALASRYL